MKNLIMYKRCIVLFLIFIVCTSFDRDDKVFNRLSKLYTSDKENCLILAKHMIERKSDNYIPYIFALKCELDTNNFRDAKQYVYVYGISSKKTAKKLIKTVRRLVKYAKIIEKNLDEEIQCRSGYLVDAECLISMISTTAQVILKWCPDSKDSFIKHCKPICDFYSLSESGSSYGKNPAYGSTRYTVDTTFYLNGLPTGNENFESSSRSEEMTFLRILNQAREEKGLHKLKICKDLSRAARYHSYDMGTQNYFSHSSYDRQGECGNLDQVAGFGERCRKFIKVWGMGENIAAGNYDAQSTYEQWYHSTGHYKNMFHDRWTHIGIGLIKIPNSTYTYYWTTDFR